MVQMPALNTPQFGWVKSRLKYKAQPVPPIFQPEVGATAIYWAAHHRRREIYVGWPTVQAIMGNKLAPGLLDRYLGRRGCTSQQTLELEDPNRANNLWNPIEEDRGAQGTFDADAHQKSYQLWADRNRVCLGLGLAAVTSAGLLIVSSARRGRSRLGMNISGDHGNVRHKER